MHVRKSLHMGRLIGLRRMCSLDALQAIVCVSIECCILVILLMSLGLSFLFTSHILALFCLDFVIKFVFSFHYDYLLSEDSSGLMMAYTCAAKQC
eukprot:c31314_g1_i1 orf=139-423(+)